MGTFPNRWPKLLRGEKMNEIKHTRHIPKDIQLTGIRHAKEAICDLLNEQAESIAERDRLRQINAQLVAALEGIIWKLERKQVVGTKFDGGVMCEYAKIDRNDASISHARAALTAAKGE